MLRAEPLDLCITTELERVRLTADLALGDRDVPRLVVGELNDPLYGPYEGRTIEEYRALGDGRAVVGDPGDGGESRYAIVERYVRGFRLVLERPEESILVVAHSLPISYLLGALEGLVPGARVPLVPYAIPYGLTAEELERSARRARQAGSPHPLGRRRSALEHCRAWGSSSGSTSTSGGTS